MADVAITEEQSKALTVYGIQGEPVRIFDYFENVNYTALVRWNFLYTVNPLLQWSDAGVFYTSAVDEVLFTGKTPVNFAEWENVYRIRYAKLANTIFGRLYIEDDNLNNIANFEIRPNSDAYDYWTTDRSGGHGNTALYLIMTTGINSNGDPTATIGFACEINADRKMEYPIINSYQYVTDLNGWSLGLEGSYVQWLYGLTVDEEGEAPEGTTGGGGGDYFRPDYEIPIPSLPTFSVIDTGFATLYQMTRQQLADLATFLWSPNFYDNVIKNLQSPIENIIFLGVVPIENIQTALDTVVIGNVASGIQCAKVQKTYYEINCGTLDVSEYYKTFADYETNISIFLPYIGVQTLDVNDIMAGKITVVYHVDVFSGECVCFLLCYTGKAWHVLHSYNGNILTTYPINGSNFMGVYSGLLNSVASFATGNVMGGVNALINTKPTTQRSGQLKGVAGMLGIQKPYLIYDTPEYFTSNKYRDYKGNVSNLSRKVNEFKGFLKGTTNGSKIYNINCTDTERQMILDAINNGIFVNELVSRET